MPQQQKFVSKQSYKYRWLVMSFAVWIVLGAYFCYDIPASLHNTLKDHMDNIDGDVFEIYFSGLYSIYAFANIFLPFISGGFRDVMGDRFVVIMLGVLVVFGQTVFTYGVMQKSFVIMYVGRVFLGWGIESMLPTLTSFISPYYKEDYLAFSVGMNQLFAHIGLVLCMLVCPIIAETRGLIVANSIGIFLNVGTFFLGVIALLFDQNSEDNIEPYDSLQDENQSKQNQPDHGEKLDEVPSQQVQEEQKEDDLYLQAHQVRSEVIAVRQQGFLSHAFNFSEVAAFPRLFWYMAIFYAIVYTSVLALVNVSVGFFTETWLQGVDNAEKEASKIVAMMWFLTGSMTPLFGVMIDYFGHRSALSVFAALLCMTAHFLVLVNQPFVGLMLLGFALALAFATIWTGIVYVVNPNQYGKAYGVIVSLYNAAFTLVPLIVGLLRAYTKTYFLSQIFLAFLGVIALIFALLIYHEDHHTGGRIDKGLYVGDLDSSASFYRRPQYYRNFSAPVFQPIEQNQGQNPARIARSNEEQKQ